MSKKYEVVDIERKVYTGGFNITREEINANLIGVEEGRKYKISFERNGGMVSAVFLGVNLLKVIDRLNCGNLEGTIYELTKEKVEVK